MANRYFGISTLLVLLSSSPVSAQRGRPMPHIEARPMEHRSTFDGRSGAFDTRDPTHPRDFKEWPKAEREHYDQLLLKEEVKIVQNDAQKEAAPYVASFLRDVKRTDWSFVQLYRWEPIDPSQSSFSVGRHTAIPRWLPSDPFNKPMTKPTPPDSALSDRLRNGLSISLLDLQTSRNYQLPPTTPRTGDPDLRALLKTFRKGANPLTEQPNFLVSADLLSVPSMRAIVYSPSPGTQPSRTDVGTESALAQAQGKARFALVNGARNLADLKAISGHVIVLPGEVSGATIQRVMDTVDRFINSFEDPKEWSRQPPASKRALLIVRNKKEEIIVNVNLAESATQGRIICSLLRPTGQTEAELKSFRERIATFLKRYSGERLYVAGDALTFVNLDELARAEDIELVHRDLTHRRSMMATEQRLQDLHGRTLSPKHLALLNGIPSTPEAVEVLGPFAGDAEQWLHFRSKVEIATQHVKSKSIETKEEFFHELRTGQQDVLILVAHADGTTVFLNGEAVPLAEIERLPSRSNLSKRPRLAVLLSCYAGAEARTIPAWRRWIFSQKQTASLGDILVRKGFVDRVIAPNRTIRPQETISILRALLNGTPTNAKNFREGWVNWATIRQFFGYAG
jgi:hypothetical protein